MTDTPVTRLRAYFTAYTAGTEDGFDDPEEERSYLLIDRVDGHPLTVDDLRTVIEYAEKWTAQTS
jgi:hypothetical protein